MAIGLAAVLSGGAALSYEICWSRALVVPLGNSTDAAAVVLAGFMLGIAAGARLAGGMAERSSSPLRLYALLEVLLGLYALLAPSLLSELSDIPATIGGLPLGVVARYGLALVLIALPSLAMGATLPLLIRAVTGPTAPLRLQISIVYGANTLGAGVGACITGFWAIAAGGIWLSSAGAAIGSTAAAGLALLASLARSPRAPDEQIPTEQLPEMARRDLRQLALAAAFLGGFIMLASELLWARVLTFVFGHDTYAFASLLATVLLGLGIGGLAHRLFAQLDQAKLLIALLGLFALALLLSFWGAAEVVVRLGRNPFGLEASGSLATSIRLELYRELLYTPLLVLLPSVFSGALYPTACSLYGGSAADTGRKVGVVGLVNGVGSAAGALTAALGLVVIGGLQGAFVLLALLAGVLSTAGILLVGSWRKSTRVSVALLPTLGLMLLATQLPAGLPRQMLLKAVGERHQRLLYYEEGRTGTVSVIENSINGERQLLMNAVNEVTTRLVHDQSFKLLGHFAPLLHREPRSGLMICLGAGLSAGAALTHPLHRLDVVDLSPAVARAARYFSSENNGVLDHPRFHLSVGDGRQFLLNSDGGYDVAIIDSTHPKSVDSWILYTHEFYRVLHARLGEGGIIVQWLPVHGLSEQEFKIIVRTFQSAFPEMTLWANAGFETYGQVAYAKMVGVKGGPLIIDTHRLTKRLSEPRIQRDLAPFGIATIEEVLDLFLAGPQAIRDWTAGLPVQTDDHPIVPYVTPYSRGRAMVPSLLLAVRSPVAPLLARGRSPDLDQALREAYDPQGLVLAGNLSRAAELRPQGDKIRLYQAQARTTLPYYTALAQLYHHDPDRLFEAGTQLASLGHPREARTILERAFQLRPTDFRVRLNLALLQGQLGERKQSIQQLTRLRSLQPDSAITHYNLGAAILASGEPAVARAHLQQALAWDPGSLSARLSLSQACFDAGDLDCAGSQAIGLLSANRWIAEAHDLLGLIAAKRKEHQTAVKHHGRAVSLNPYRPSFHYNLGLALQEVEQLERAMDAYERALGIRPYYPAALNNLGLIYHAQKRYDKAVDHYLRTLDEEPHNAAAAHNLGVTRREQGLKAEAIQAFCMALSSQPNLTAARQQLAELGQEPRQCGR